MDLNSEENYFSGYEIQLMSINTEKVGSKKKKESSVDSQ